MMAPVRSPKRSFRLNSPFSTEQCAFVIFEYGRLQSLKLVQREFRKKYFPKNPREVPRLNAFHRLVERFKKDAAVRPKVTPGPPETSAEDVQRVKSFFQRKKKAHIRQAVQSSAKTKAPRCLCPMSDASEEGGVLPTFPLTTTTSALNVINQKK